ncbi:hypothetical protein [Sediminitomix flava]|uniref:Uncharacterized protein n=1 Tax=Sediminitomix flava TaxID=379075 RepID=A0A315Z9W4_SEDFL|nr:hypothetical protein [Sediminitomix flava]PWJ40860.1 hypothetical protein BC781_104120 [Sediminitomix flava]
MKLSDNYKKNPFSAPKGYFDTLPDKVIKTVELEKKSTKEISFIRKNSWSIAASIALLIGISAVLWQKIETTAPQNTEVIASYFEDISNRELYEYLNNSDLSYEQLVDYLDEESIQNLITNDLDIDNEILLDDFTFDELSELL